MKHWNVEGVFKELLKVQLQTRTNVQTLNSAHRTGREQVCAAQPQQGRVPKSLSQRWCVTSSTKISHNVSTWMAGSCLSQKWLAQLQGLFVLEDKDLKPSTGKNLFYLRSDFGSKKSINWIYKYTLLHSGSISLKYHYCDTYFLINYPAFTATSTEHSPSLLSELS